MLVVNGYIDFTAPLMIQLPQLESAGLPTPDSLKQTPEAVMSSWFLNAQRLMLLSKPLAHWPFLQGHPFPALELKKPFGKWVGGMHSATEHALGSCEIVYTLKKEQTTYSHVGSPLPQRWKVISLHIMTFWVMSDWIWEHLCSLSYILSWPRELSSQENI